MNAWEPVFAFALPVALGGVVISAVVLAAAWLLRRCSEPLRYGLLMAGVLGLLAVPALVGVAHAFPDAFRWRTAASVEEIVRVPAEMLPDLLDAHEVDRPEPARPVGSPLPAFLISVWALGTILGLTRLIVALCRYRRALIGRPWQAEFWTDGLQAHLAAKLGLAKFPRVHVSPAAPMPMVIGLIRPTIVLPEAAPASWQQGQWEAVLLHEAAHIARRDQWAALAQNLAVLLFWWCPPVHWISRRLSDLRESICDDCALQGPCDQIAYAELLVESAERFLDFKPTPVPLALLDSARGGLEARVTRLLEKERQPMTRLTFAGKLLGAGFLVAACLLTTAATAFSQAQPQPQKKVQIKILVDGKEIDLSDFKLLDLLGGGAKPAPVAPPVPAAQPVPPVPPAPAAAPVAGIAQRKLTASPDGKLLVASDGKVLIVTDAATGKIIAKIEHGKGEAATADVLIKHIGLTVAGEKRKPDPRIEELVALAEKIKPGSGAEIRRALEGSKPPASSAHSEYAKAIEAYMRALGPTGGRAVEVQGGKRIIIVIEDGKVKQITDGDLKKMIDKDVWYRIERKQVEAKKAETKPLEAPPAKAPPKTIGLPTPPAPVAPPRPADDTEALRRHLERLAAELQDLKKRLDSGKK